MNKALVDTSFLYGTYDESDKYHEQAIAWGTANPNYHLIIADVVLVEATYLIQHK
jgi:predicted nucleic acid-binding protein